MKGNKYLIFGIVFLAIGVTMLMTGAVSRTMAYGDLVLAAAFFALSTRAGKKSDDGNKDEEKPDKDKGDK
jgi:hypothetical protein